MINIEELKPQIIKALMSLNPDKIILFGSYAYGEPNEDSDIDLFLLKDDLTIDDTRYYQREARRKLLDIRLKYKTNGIDILSAHTEYLENREELLKKTADSGLFGKIVKE